MIQKTCECGLVYEPGLETYCKQCGMQHPVQDFAEFLTELRQGLFHQEVSQKMQSLTAAVQKYGKKGTMTIKLDVKPEGSYQAFVNATCKIVTPEPTTEPTLFFLTDDKGLSRRDPRQLTFDAMEQK